MNGGQSRGAKVAGIFLIAVLLPTSATTQAPPGLAPALSNPVMRDGWVVHWAISQDDGLEISNVTFNGMPVLKDGRLMGILVYYVHHICAFYDEIGASPPAFTNATLEEDDIVVSPLVGGGFNLTAFADVPDYLYSQYWTFMPDGSFRALLRISGGGCYDIHVYHSIWRFEFPRYGGVGNSMFAYSDSGWVPIRTESDLNDSGLRDPQNEFTAWRIGNGSFYYYLAPYDFPSGQESPAELVALVAHPGELDNSHDPHLINPRVYENGERLFRTDLSLWYASSHVHNAFANYSLIPPITTGVVFYPGYSSRVQA